MPQKKSIFLWNKSRLMQPISLKIKMVYLIAKDKESDGQASRAIDFRLEAFRMKISFGHHITPAPQPLPLSDPPHSAHKGAAELTPTK